jgi:hypothetical protein
LVLTEFLTAQYERCRIARHATLFHPNGISVVRRGDRETVLDNIAIEGLKRAMEELELEVRLLESGRRAILDIKDGRISYVSRDVLSEKQVYTKRLSGLISKLNAEK